MDFEKERIEKLRDRLRKCYAFIHRDDIKRLGYLQSTKTSEKNPFIEVLSVDLNERFEDARGNVSQGYSVYTLRNIFFNDDKLNYDGDTIANMELYCSEIEKEMQPIEIKKDRRKPIYKHWFFILVSSIVGFLFVLYVVLSEMGNRVITPFEKALETTLVGEFDPDPAKKGMGFASIHKGDVPDNSANLFDAIKLSGLESGEDFIFTVFTDFHNMGIINIEEAKVKLYVSKQEAKNKLIINSELSASNAPSINDMVTIEGLPIHYDIELIKLKKENTHGKTDPKECTGYSYEIDLELEDAKQGVDLDVLDSKYNGWCDQGYVIAVYKIIAQ